MELKEVTEERFIECLAIDFPTFKITKSNLTHPTSHFVTSFYALILRHIIEISDPEEIWNLTEDQRNYMSAYHPEASTFGQHVWASNLHAAVKYVFNQLSQNGTEFVFSDILFPENTPRRSFVFMALMLNFYWYSNDFAVDLNNDMTACLEEVQLMNSLKGNKEKLVNQLQECEDQKSYYAESCQNVKASIRKCMESNEVQENLLKETLDKEESLKLELRKIENEEQKLQEIYAELQTEKKNLGSLIVSNQSQVIDIHQKHLIKKDECVKKIKSLEEQSKIAATKLHQNKIVLELQQKLNSFLKDEKFPTEHQGKQKGFRYLFENINIMSEKKKKIEEEESAIERKIIEARETLSRLQSEYQQNEALQEEILLKSKEKSAGYANLIEDLKKNHYQLFFKMKNGEADVEEFTSVSAEMNDKCDELDEKIKQYDAENKEKYMSYAKDMTSALNSLQAIFGEDRKFF